MSGTGRKFDYDVMEKDYITSDLSLRALASKYGVENHSLVMIASKKRGWAAKRAEFRERAAQRAISHMADVAGQRAARELEVRDHAIEAIDEAVQKMRADMKDTVKVPKTIKTEDGTEEIEMVDTGVPVMRVGPRDLVVLIDRLNILFGRPSSITEERTLGLSFNAETSPDVLRQIADAARGRAGSEPGRVGGSALPRIEDPRPN